MSVDTRTRDLMFKLDAARTHLEASPFRDAARELIVLALDAFAADRRAELCGEAIDELAREAEFEHRYVVHRNGARRDLVVVDVLVRVLEVVEQTLEHTTLPEPFAGGAHYLDSRNVAFLMDCIRAAIENLEQDVGRV